MELLPLFIAVIPLLIALHKTEWGIWAFLFMIPGYAMRVSVGPAEISMVEIAALLLLPAIFFALRNLSTQSAPRWRGFLGRPQLLTVSIVIFIAGLFISLSQSNDIMASLGIIRGWVLVPIIFAFLFGAWMRNSGVPIRFFVSAFVVSGIVVALTAPFWGNAWGGGRLHGFYESPNYLAMYLAPLIPLIAWYAKEYWHKHIVRYVILGGLAVVLLAVLFSLSRGAWIGVLGGSFLAIPLFGRSWLRRNWGAGVFGASALAAIIVAALAFSPFYALLQGALHSRLGIWEAAYEMLAQSPLWGVGAGMFQTAFMVKKTFCALSGTCGSSASPSQYIFSNVVIWGALRTRGIFWEFFWRLAGVYILKSNQTKTPHFTALLLYRLLSS